MKNIFTGITRADSNTRYGELFEVVEKFIRLESWVIADGQAIG